MHTTTEDAAAVLEQLRRAVHPEDLFGDLGEEDGRQQRAKKYYNWVAKIVHPDTGIDGATQQDFENLQRLWRAVERKIADGTYGTSRATSADGSPVTVTSRRHSYTLASTAVSGDIADVYRCDLDDGDGAAVLKIVRDPRNNDLAENEHRILADLRKQVPAGGADAQLLSHIPEPVDAFRVRDEDNKHRQANAFRYVPGFYTLAEVERAYPSGVHPGDMAWMCNRLLAALALVHTYGVVHGAVTPAHVLISPEDHNGLLVDWSYAVKADESHHIQAVSPPYKELYPPEVLRKEVPTPATDIYMAGKTMIRLLGGSTTARSLPTRVPKPFRFFLESLIIEAPHRRTTDTWSVFDRFQEILEEVFEKRQWRAFAMPHAAAV